MIIENTKRNYLENYAPNLKSTLDKSIQALTLGQGIQVYLKWKASYAQSASIRYKIRLDTFADFIGRDIQLNQITGDQVSNYHTWLQYDKGYAPGTVAFSIRIIKDFIQFWNGRHQTQINIREIRNIRYVTPEKEMLTDDEFYQLTSSLDEHYLEDLLPKLIFHMLWDTGCRVSEVCDLEIGDLIESKVPGLKCAKIRRRKTMRYNIISWGVETNRLLDVYLGHRLGMDVKSDALFLAKRGSENAITTRTIQRWTLKYTRETLIDKHITPHSFRHSKAHRILNKSQNVRDVQAILGHRNPASSFNYLNLNFDSIIDTSLKYLGV